MSTAETSRMEGPVWYVELPDVDLLFPGDEYERAYQHAVGVKIDEEDDLITDEIREERESFIHLMDWDGVVEVPHARSH